MHNDTVTETQADALLARCRGIYTEAELQALSRLEYRIIRKMTWQSTDSDDAHQCTYRVHYTRRQRQLLRLLRRGLSLSAAAAELGIRPGSARQTLARAHRRFCAAMMRADEIAEAHLDERYRGLHRILWNEFGAGLRSNWPRMLIELAGEVQAGRI